jgi:hypothetical protein
MDNSRQNTYAGGVSQNEDNDQKLNDLNQETNDFRQRSTAVGTAAWKSQYAQQRERERSTETNNNQYRKQFMRSTNSNENQRPAG